MFGKKSKAIDEMAAANKAAIDGMQASLEELTFGAGSNAGDHLVATSDGTSGDAVWTSDNTIHYDPASASIGISSGTSTTTGPYWQAGDLVVGGGDSLVTLQYPVRLGPMTLDASPEGHLEVVFDTPEGRKEYHIDSKVVKDLLEKLAYVVVDGHPTSEVEYS